MERALLILFGVVLYGGLLLPAPMLVLAWREWIRGRGKIADVWGRVLSLLALMLCSVGILLWTYTLVAEARGAVRQAGFYDSWIFYVGIFGSLATLIPAGLSAGRLRNYLLLCAAGLLLFFCFSAGEAI